MPSPVGHSLIGLAIGGAYLLPRVPARELCRSAWSNRYALVGAAALANAPDVDYLPGILSGDLNSYHHVYTHSLGWIAIVAAGLWLYWRGRRGDAGIRTFLFLFVLLASHLVADWLTQDRKIPYGIMALWPFTDRYMQAPVWIFPSAHKANWAECFQWHNVLVALVEAAVCLPFVGLVVAAKISRRGK